MRKILVVLLAVLFGFGVSSVYAEPFLPGADQGSGLWTASDADGRSASAVFDISGSTLSVTVANTAGFTEPKTVPNEVLMGIFFSLDGCTISDPHVEVASLSTLEGIVSGPAGTSLDGEYGFLADINPASNFGFGEYGVSASSLDGGPASWDGFGVGSLISSTNMSGAAAPNGPDYGMVGIGADADLSNSIDPYVLNSVLMEFDITGMCSLGDVEKVTFIYGTSMVPEPASMLLFGAGLAGLVGFRKKFKK